MKFVAAYLLAYLGAETTAAAAAAAAAAEGAEGGDADAAMAAAAGPARPSKEDVRRILGSVGAEVEEERLDLLFEQLEGKDVADLLAAGREQLAYAPSGAAAGVAFGGAPAPGGAAAEGKEGKEEEKEEEEEGEDDMEMFNIFGDDE